MDFTLDDHDAPEDLAILFNLILAIPFILKSSPWPSRDRSGWLWQLCRLLCRQLCRLLCRQLLCSGE